MFDKTKEVCQSPEQELKQNIRAKMSESTSFTVGDIIRIPNYETCKGYRVWKIVGVYLGGFKARRNL